MRRLSLALARTLLGLLRIVCQRLLAIVCTVVRGQADAAVVPTATLLRAYHVAWRSVARASVEREAQGVATPIGSELPVFTNVVLLLSRPVSNR